MGPNEIFSRIDHTFLAQTAVLDDIRKLCDEAVEYSAASVCIPPSFVRAAKEYIGDKMRICTVIGFPNGYSTTAVKCFETDDAIKNGADEIDMVINIGWAKEGRFDDIRSEIAEIKKRCGSRTLKVIIETCLLTREEKIRLCRTVAQGGADFIKTSTGFSSAGATFDDISLMRENSPEYLKIKAAGGIKTLSDAQTMISLGADRLGTSRIIKSAASSQR